MGRTTKPNMGPPIRPAETHLINWGVTACPLAPCVVICAIAAAMATGQLRHRGRSCCDGAHDYTECESTGCDAPLDEVASHTCIARGGASKAAVQEAAAEGLALAGHTRGRPG